MAKVDPTMRQVRASGPAGRCVIVTWGPISAGDEIGWYDVLTGGACDSFQIEGDFGGAQCAIEGSNTGQGGRRLRNRSGMETLTGAGDVADIATPTRFVRPSLDGGDQSTNLVVTAYGRGL